MSTLVRRFEGAARLNALLAEAGSVSDTEDVAEAFRQALKHHVPPQVVIEALFEDEPRFPSPSDAAALYGNLLGLYDLLEAGGNPDWAAGMPVQRPREKPQAVPPPGLFPKAGPSEE